MFLPGILDRRGRSSNRSRPVLTVPLCDRRLRFEPLEHRRLLATVQLAADVEPDLSLSSPGDFTASVAQAYSQAGQVASEGAQQLGTVDYLELEDVAAGDDPTWYEFEAARGGILTMAARVTSLGGVDYNPEVEMSLFDDEGNLLVTSERALWPDCDCQTPLDAHIWFHGFRGDADTQSAHTYLLRVTGENAIVDLRLVNLVSILEAVSQGGGESFEIATVTGTSGDDDYGILLGNNAFAVAGIPYNVADDADTITFDGGEGDDSGAIYGTEDDESMVLWPGQASVATTAVVSLVNTETIDVHSGGGRDDASFYDSAGNDTYTADPSNALLVGPGYHNASHGFEINHAYAKSGGEDSAVFSGTDGKDYFKADSRYSKMFGPDFYNRAKFFEHNTAQGSGRYDYARLWDSPSNDTLEGRRNQVRLYNDSWNVTVLAFPQVLAYSTNGGRDQSHLADSSLDDVAIAKRHKTQIFDRETMGTTYRITARWFEMMYLDAVHGGWDIARLFDTWNDDHIDATAEWALMTQVSPNPRPLYEVRGFARVAAYSTIGYDTATWNASLHVTLNDRWVIIDGPGLPGGLVPYQI